MLAYAQEVTNTAIATDRVLNKVNDVILFPLITLLMSVALVVFLWGGFQFIANAENDVAREQGKKHMFWGIIGLFVMLTAQTILRIAVKTVGA